MRTPTTVPVHVARKRKVSAVRYGPPITVLPSASAWTSEPVQWARYGASSLRWLEPLLEQADANTPPPISPQIVAAAVRDRSTRVNHPPLGRPRLVMTASLALKAFHRATFGWVMRFGRRTPRAAAR